MNKQTYSDFVRLQNEVSSFYLDFINKLINEELQILERNKELIFNYLHDFNHSIKFHDIHYIDLHNTSKGYKFLQHIEAKNFKVDEVTEYCLVMKYNEEICKIQIPFNMSEKDHTIYIAEYFKPLYTLIDKTIAKNKRKIK